MAIVGLSSGLPPDRQVDRIFRALSDPLASEAAGGMLDRLGSVVGRKFDSEQDAYRWLAAEQARGRMLSIRLPSITADMRAIAATRLAALRAQRQRGR